MPTTLRLTVLIFVLLEGISPILAQQRITVQINKHTDQGTERYDTTFVAPDDFEVETWLETTRLQHTNPGESVSTTIIIHDQEDRKASADVFRPDQVAKEPGMMGVYLQDDPGQSRGVPITSIIAGSAASEAGLQGGDTITGINGRLIRQFDDLDSVKKGMFAGDELTLRYKRGEEIFSTTLILQGRNPMVEGEEKVSTHSPRVYLGVYTQDLNRNIAEELGLEDLRGVYLNDILAGTPAEIAGLERGDVIITLNGRDIEAAWELSEILRELTPGEALQIGYLRAGEVGETIAILGKRPSPSPRVEEKPRRILIEESGAFLGVMLQSDGEATGVTILEVEPHSAAEQAGLQAGDQIIRLAGKKADTYDGLSEIMRQLPPGDKVAIIYLRNGRRKRTTAILGNRTSQRWILADPEENLDPLTLAERVRSRNHSTGDQLADHLNAPSLEVAFFELYPNPNQGLFTLNIELVRPEDISINMYNPEGELVYSREVADFSGVFREDINLGEHIEQGLYLIHITQGSAGMVTNLIVQP